ncbi:MAG TPA: M17 family peptidase N-terminal domain-containing protein, partial [Burkholderiaceae bacterium]|nr:M17 family peptidase N-terminal domain-containing protein [Burkholderiaceae bacterium]
MTTIHYPRTRLKFSTKAIVAEQARTDCLIVFAYGDGSLSDAAKRVDQAAKGALTRAIKARDITGKIGSSIALRELPGVTATRVLLAGAGDADDWNAKHFADALRAAYKAAHATGAKSLAVASTDALSDRDAAWAVRHAVVLAREAAYRFDELKSK